MTVQRVRIGDVLKLDRQAVTPDPMHEYVAIGTRSFGKGIFHYEPTLGDQLGKLRFFKVVPERLIVSNIKGWEGAVAVSTEDDEGCVASQRFLIYAPIDDRIDVRWARWYFLSDAGNELIQHASPGSADRNRTLAIRRFEGLKIPLPPIREQRQVACWLERVASTVEALQGLRARSSALLTATPLAVAVQAEREVPLAPTRLGEVLEPVREAITIDPVAPYVSIGIRSFGRGVFHYPVRPGAEIGKLRFQAVLPRLLAISNIKAWEGAVATTEEADAGTVASNRFLFFRPRAGEDATDYFWALLLSPEGLAVLGQASPGSADRNRTLGADRLDAITLNLPKLEEQAEIGRRVRAARLGMANLETRAQESNRRIGALISATVNEAFASLS